MGIIDKRTKGIQFEVVKWEEPTDDFLQFIEEKAKSNSNVNTGSKTLWIARDKKNDELCVYVGEKPCRYKDEFVSLQNSALLVIDNTLFPEVTWENSPVKAKLVIDRRTIKRKK